MATESSAPPIVASATATGTIDGTAVNHSCATPMSETRRMALALTRLSRQAELAIAEAELTLSQYRVLAVLDQGCEASSKLAEKLAVSRPSVTGVVDGLVVRGLVRRNQGDQDRRRVDLDLTDAGRETLLAADAAIERRSERIEDLLGELRA